LPCSRLQDSFHRQHSLRALCWTASTVSMPGRDASHICNCKMAVALACSSIEHSALHWYNAAHSPSLRPSLLPSLPPSRSIYLFVSPPLTLRAWLPPLLSFRPAWPFQQGGCGCLGPIFGAVPPGAHWPQEKGLTSNEQILGFLDVRDVVSSFIVGEWVWVWRGGVSMVFGCVESAGAAVSTGGLGCAVIGAEGVGGCRRGG
jgi:hypothetical protein